MKYRTLDEIRPVAEVVPIGPTARMLRRQRLERFATVLDQYKGPLRLLSRIEYLPESERPSLRSDFSPLTVAFQDPVLRGQGLAGDRLGDAIEFFDLSQHEAHHLFCDCHYAASITPPTVSARVRTIASRLTFGEVWARLSGAVRSWMSGGRRW